MRRSIFRLACLVFVSTMALTASAAKAQPYDYSAHSASYENIYVDSFGRVNVVGLQVWWLDGYAPGTYIYNIHIDFAVTVDGVLLGSNSFFEDVSGTPAISRDPQNPDSAPISLQSAALSPGWHTVAVYEAAYVEDFNGWTYTEPYIDTSECRYNSQTQVYVP
jgi:hypothetical protein